MVRRARGALALSDRTTTNGGAVSSAMFCFDHELMMTFCFYFRSTTAGRCAMPKVAPRPSADVDVRLGLGRAGLARYMYMHM
jgi:hypothetical protein